MKKFSTALWFVLVLVLLCTFSCTSIDRPSVCDTIQSGDSVLCDIASKQGISLESVGNGLIVVNAIALTSGAYTSDQAVSVLRVIREALDGPVTYAIFKLLLEDNIAQYPQLLDVLGIYLEQFGLSQYMSDIDKEILRGWLNDRITSLQAI